jgi:hypothetical protein
MPTAKSQSSARTKGTGSRSPAHRKAESTSAPAKADHPDGTQAQAAPGTLDRVTGIVTAPVAAADRILPAMGGVPLYLGLAGLAAVGILEWPVAAAAGLGYAGYAVLHRGRGSAASA